jgi:hypothetical protein
MPFTFLHPAIVLPLTYLPRQWFSLTGLVIGSLTSDFEYVLRVNDKSYQTLKFSYLKVHFNQIILHRIIKHRVL